MSEKVYGCSRCRPKKFFLGEGKYLEHQKLHGGEYLCDYVCECPARDVAERVQRETIEKVLAAVEGLQRMSPGIKSIPSTTEYLMAIYTEADGGELLVRSEVLEAIREVEL